jgi:hypothetical protein
MINNANILFLLTVFYLQVIRINQFWKMGNMIFISLSKFILSEKKVYHSLPTKYILLLTGACLAFQAYGEINFSWINDMVLYQILNLKTITAREILDTSREQNPSDIYLKYLESKT